MNPFVQALGTGLEDLARPVRDHFRMGEGGRVFQGRMRAIERRGGWRGFLAYPVFWLGSRSDLLFTETGTDIPFRLENRVHRDPDGILRMDWIRTFSFPRARRCFKAVMRHGRGPCLQDFLGRDGLLEVELWPSVRDGMLEIVSGRQWVRFKGLRLRLPRWLAGEARVLEWALDDTTLGIRVELWNPLLGCVFAYEGSFREEARA